MMDSCGSRGLASSLTGGASPSVMALVCWSAVYDKLRRYIRNVSLRQRRRFLIYESETWCNGVGLCPDADRVTGNCEEVLVVGRYVEDLVGNLPEECGHLGGRDQSA
jgi:hypothetical protein